MGVFYTNWKIALALLIIGVGTSQVIPLIALICWAVAIGVNLVYADKYNQKIKDSLTDHPPSKLTSSVEKLETLKTMEATQEVDSTLTESSTESVSDKTAETNNSSSCCPKEDDK